MEEPSRPLVAHGGHAKHDGHSRNFSTSRFTPSAGPKGDFPIDPCYPFNSPHAPEEDFLVTLCSDSPRDFPNAIQ